MVLENFLIDVDVLWDRAGKELYEKPDARAGRKMRVRVTNKGLVEDLTGYALNLGWRSTIDETKFGLDAFTAVDITKGIFELPYTSGMLTNIGTLLGTLQLVPPAGTPTESNNFMITVKRSGVDVEAIQSETSFTALTSALLQVQNLESTYAPELLSVKQQLEQTRTQWVNVNDFKKIGIETDDTLRIQRAIDSIPNGGVVYFPNVYGGYVVSSSVLINNHNTSLIGDGFVELHMPKQTTNKDLIRINNGNNCIISGFKFIADGALNGMDSKIECIKIINATNITIENIISENMLYTVKADYGVSNINKLTTRNISGTGCAMFMHIANCDGWFGDNLRSELDVASTTALDHHYYIKCKVSNIQLSNVFCKNSGGGHAIQFDRYQSGIPDEPIGNELAKNKNITIANLTVVNCGCALMFNSEIENITVINLIVDTMNRNDLGVFDVSKGKLDGFKATNIVAKNINTLFNFSANHEGVGSFEIFGVTIKGNTRNRLQSYGSVKLLKLKSITYENVIPDVAVGGLLYVFNGNFAKIVFEDVFLDATRPLGSANDVVRFAADFVGKVYMNNVVCNLDTNETGVVSLFYKFTGASISIIANGVHTSKVSKPFNNLVKNTDIIYYSCTKDFTPLA